MFTGWTVEAKRNQQVQSGVRNKYGVNEASKLKVFLRQTGSTTPSFAGRPGSDVWTPNKDAAANREQSCPALSSWTLHNQPIPPGSRRRSTSSEGKKFGAKSHLLSVRRLLHPCHPLPRSNLQKIMELGRKDGGQ